MFTVDERVALRDELVAAAREDSRITGAALTGSGAVGAEDEWSDIDLAFGLAPGVDQDAMIADWTRRLQDHHGAVDHTDVPLRNTVYRVFLLENTLQVDLAFAPAEEFGALGPSFRLLFGAAVEQPGFRTPVAADLIGMGWLYALHARSSIARGRHWQAEYMLSGLRDHILDHACLRHGHPTASGRGYDLLPEAITRSVEPTLVRSLDPAELTRALAAAVDVLLAEAEATDAALAKRLSGPLRELAGPA